MNALKFKSFKRSEDSLDQFYFERLKVPTESFLGKLLQALFVLHNGQAEVERGFSINKGLLEKNMKEETITSRRRIKDYMYNQGNSGNFFQFDLWQPCTSETVFLGGFITWTTYFLYESLLKALPVLSILDHLNII